MGCAKQWPRVKPHKLCEKHIYTEGPLNTLGELNMAFRYTARLAVLTALVLAPWTASAATSYTASFVTPTPSSFVVPSFTLPDASVQVSSSNASGDTAGSITSNAYFEVFQAGQFDPAHRDLAGYTLLKSGPDTWSPGSSWVSYSGHAREAYVSHEGSVQRLGTLGFGESGARFINDRGQVAGEAYDRMVTVTYDRTGARVVDPQLAGFAEDRPRQHVFLYDNGVMKDLGTLGGTRSYLQALNKQGDVLGSSFLAGDNLLHAFVYHNGQITEFGAANQSSYASLLNDRGDVAGVMGNEAFAYLDGVQHQFGTMGGLSTSVNAMSGQGVVAGSIHGQDGRQGAFLYKDGLTQILPSMLGKDGQKLDLFASGVNDRGDVFGVGISSQYNEFHPFVFSNGELTDLTSVVAWQDGFPQQDIFSPTIDNDGRITLSGSVSDLVLTPASAVPESGSVMYMLTGLFLLAGLSMRRPK
jgi:probable HAF family extracellular repeat protein